MYVCLWSPAWSTGGASPGEAGLLLADRAPRLRVEREVIWADGRGLDAVKLAVALLEALSDGGVAARAGVAAIPVAALAAATLPTTPPLPPRSGDRGNGGTGERPSAPPGGETIPFLVKERTGWGFRRPEGAAQSGAAAPPPFAPSPIPSTGVGRVVGVGGVGVVEGGREVEWLAPLPIRILSPDPRLESLLEGVGLATVGDLARLDRESVEVRFGADAVSLWRLARGDDRRVLFRPVPPERPHGSIDFVDYVLTDPARLVFTANALLGPLCDRLAGRGEHARALRLVLPLANGEAWERTIRPARPTASRDTWLRLIRGLLDRLTVPDAVTGMALEVGATEPAGVRQGDLFDRGFATASAVEAAIARLAERQAAPVEPETNGHPLMERRATYSTSTSTSTSNVASRPPVPPSPPRGEVGGGGLTLQLLPEPRRLLVETAARRDHERPVRLRDRGGWREVVLAAGPDRISGGRWEAEPFAREYYRCVTDEGVPLWVYRDGRDGGWFLHGWWD